ncbi:MAG: alpha-glucosidase/alpha-galactosidase [Oscillospiraceae bacterium]|jgi:alpha-galactosidase|nr:alpha-glucosidase/alpha-galactosidase [Oscillospiraceae bacterium]
MPQAHTPLKIAFIGAGSFGFTRSLVRDLLTFPAMRDATIALMDIDPVPLGHIRRACQRIIDEGQYPAKLIATLDRREALEGADGVVCTILTHKTPVWKHDVEIPKKYGVDTNVGDTRGPSGVFRYLRAIPIFLDIARDIDRYCPGAVFLNYTNPMAMLCRAVQGVYPHMKTTGLCHSVQGTAEMLAKWIDKPIDEITYTCVGINHQAFYTKFLWKGEDAYPLIRRAVTENEAIYNEEIVRNDMFLALGYYVTESSGHNSEYNWWFRKRPELIEEISKGTGWNPGAYGYILDEYTARDANWEAKIKEWFDEPLKLERGHEYAAYIFNAIVGDGDMFKFNGNVRNFGLVDNLPQGACVEVPVLASKHGFEPIHVDPMPPQCAALSGLSAQIEEMVVEGSLSGDRELITRALYYDPLSAAVLSLKEIRAMTEEMFKQNAEYLPQFAK